MGMKKLTIGALLFAGLVRAQQPPALVIEGGTLIDGNGGAPIANSVVVIQGNKIVRVGLKGRGTYPAGARVIDATGKYVLPGLIEGQSSYNWYFGEAMLNHGVTSTLDVATAGGIAVPHRDSVMLGKVLAPRSFTGIGMIASVNQNRWAVWTGNESPLSPDRVPKSADEVREMVRLRVAAGADYINFQDGSLPLDFYKAGVDEATKLGKPVFARAFGPTLTPKDAAMLGVRNLPHSSGIGAAVTKKTPAQYRFGEAGPAAVELDFYADMDDAKAKDLIQVLVEHKTRLTPTIQVSFAGQPKDWQRFGMETRALFADPNLRAYYPADAMAGSLAGFARPEQAGPAQERRKLGYQNALRFHKMFSDAGGLLIVGGNTNSNKPAGVNMHFELQSLAEAGIAPMKLIQGATKWPAEMIDKGDQLGTVEAGKLADVIVVNEDPLQNIANLDKIDTVIFDGKVVERGYHPWYSVPFPVEGNGITPAVEGLQWAASLKKYNFPGGLAEGGEGGGARAGAALPDAALSPQPAIETITPEIVTEGSGPLTVTLKGFNFVRKSMVYYNGVPVPYKAVSPTELQLMLNADLLKTPGRFSIVVKNPEPFNRVADVQVWGNGISNKAYLMVQYRK